MEPNYHISTVYANNASRLNQTWTMCNWWLIRNEMDHYSNVVAARTEMKGSITTCYNTTLNCPQTAPVQNTTT